MCNWIVCNINTIESKILQNILGKRKMFYYFTEMECLLNPAVVFPMFFPQTSYLYEVGVLSITNRHHRMHLLDQLLLLVVIKLHVPLGQPCLPCAVLDKDKADLQR